MNLRHSPKPNKPLRQLLVVLLFGILLFSLALFTVPTHAQTTGLVTCGLLHGTGTEKAFCTICDLIVLVQTIMNKAMYIFAAPIAAFMLGYGGFLMVWAGVKGGDTGMYGKGKTVMTNSLIGIVIIFSSWLLIDTLMKGLGAYQYATSANFGPWNQIECQAPPISLPQHMGCNGDTCEMVEGSGSAVCTGPKNCGPNAKHLGCKDQKCAYIPGQGTNDCAEGDDPKCNTKYHKCLETSCVEAEGSRPDECIVLGEDNPSCKTAVGYEGNADNAKKLQGRVNFSASADCNGKSAQTNFQELLNKEPLTVCHSGCSEDKTPCTKQNFTANNRMLVDVINLLDKYNFKGISVSSISTGDHTSNSAHYKGNAIDIQSADKTKYKDLRDQLRSFNPDSPYLECEGESGVIKSCGEGTNHVHVTYP